VRSVEATSSDANDWHMGDGQAAARISKRGSLARLDGSEPVAEPLVRYLVNREGSGEGFRASCPVLARHLR